MNKVDIISTFGVIFILLAFLLLSTGRLKAEGKIYNLMNIIGASLLGYSAWLLDSAPFVILEAIWVAAAIYGLINSKKGVI